MQPKFRQKSDKNQTTNETKIWRRKSKEKKKEKRSTKSVHNYET